MPRLRPLVVLLLAPAIAPAADPAPTPEYLAFIRAQAAALRAADKPPATRDEWSARREELRKNLLAAWGGFPTEPCPLAAKKLGEIKRDGYTVEKIVFQTLPGVWMTANAYVPDKRDKKLPAILHVHGHWAGAKQDKVPQARCIGSVKNGFFVLAVDAFGAGERGTTPALGEYHGEMVAATLWPVGKPLSGIQVYENMRAVDYLRSRPEVDGDRIGITGASGGGNQTMYAGAWDDRFQGVVPVCSVGNYQAYLGGACCMCEVVPGALRFTEEWGILALTAPRGLMVVNATRDARQFSVPEAKKSIDQARPVFELVGKPGNIKHAVFESGHDYNRDMREAMYGWMNLHLRGEGDGSPGKDPEIKTEDPETLRCYPGTTRPKDWVTLPMFAAAEGRKLLAAKPEPKTAVEWEVQGQVMREVLVEKVFGGWPKVPAVEATTAPTGHGGGRVVRFSPEPGLTLTAVVEPGKAGGPLAIVLNMGGGATASTSELAAEARKAGWTVAGLELRATGTLAVPGDAIHRAPDHNSAEWALWIGRPLLGQWTFDVRRLLDALEKVDNKLPSEVVVIGDGPAGLVALCAAATDKRVTKAAAVGTLASYVSDVPYVGQRMGVMAPGMLRDVGDVPHLAALAAPKRVVIAGGVTGGGQALSAEKLAEAYAPAANVWGLTGAKGGLVVLGTPAAADVVKALK